ncbi:GH92 family glycosyl hydrolase [Luteococcus sp. H138]|uniref:GH92 family glycosyl hydrolase n=1 Tax=unclassified Luteococcus TaxID=2639923 RepID=UPI00313AB2A7
MPESALSVTDYVRTTRGTDSSAGFSHGNTLPAACLPHGFNLLTPVTDARTRKWLYQWNPPGGLRLQALAFSHQPSPWIGDRAGLQLMPWTGHAHTDPKRRAIAFSHDDEHARAHHYRVALADGTVAEVTPTDHAAAFRCTFTTDEACGVLLDLPGDGWLRADLLPDGRAVITGRLEPSPGFGRRQRDPVGFCYGETRQRVRVLANPHQGLLGRRPARGRRQAVVLELPPDQGDQLEVLLATSFISVDQARHSLALEIGEADFDQVRLRAQHAWEQVLGRLELPEATGEQRIIAWSNLTRLHTWPNAMHENAGTAEEPRWVHASPFQPIGARARLRQRPTHTASPVLPGRLFVNHGYWDTYRTCWPAFHLLSPESAGDLLDGILPAFTESGWMGRWSAPGHVDSMVGTSSDVIFADASAHGIDFDELTAYASAVRNASCPPPDATVGRKGIGGGRFRGWISSETREGFSWSIENAVCDAALARWSDRLAGRADELGVPEQADGFRANAAWFTNRALGIRQLFDGRTGFLRGRRADGRWSRTEFNPLDWGGDYTETTGWGMSVSLPQDGALLAALHGGEWALADHLDRLFTTPEDADRPGHYRRVIHEMREAQAVGLGQCAPSNQPAHHIPFMPLHVGRPAQSQRVVRDALTRLFTGSEVGRGYPGDEDNGELSAWWLWAAMGLYPLAPGSGEYVLGAPLTPMTWRRDEGNLTIRTTGTGAYLASVTRNGEPWPAVAIGVAELRGEVELCFELSEHATEWGVDSRPGSLSTSELGRSWGPWRTDRSWSALWSGAPTAALERLVDNTGSHPVHLVAGTVLRARWQQPWRPRLLTLTAQNPLRPAVRARNSAAEQRWRELELRGGQAQWPRQTVAWLLPDDTELDELEVRLPTDGTLFQLEVY